MKHLITILIVLSSSLLFSQHITNFGLFQQNISFYNPSATAYRTNHYGTVQYNNKFSEFKNNPVSFFAQYEKDFEKINSGVGILMHQDRIGLATYNIGTIQYRYALKTGEESRLLFGASAGVFHSKFPEVYYFTTPTDTLNSASQGKFTMNAGVSYQWKNLYAGISAMNATRPLFDKLNFQSIIHYVAHANYDFEISERFTISPQAQLLTDIVKASATLNVRFEHYNKFWYLAGIRNVNSFMVGAGIQFWDRLYIGYLYEHFRSKASLAGPSHEAFITYKINNN